MTNFFKNILSKKSQQGPAGISKDEIPNTTTVDDDYEDVESVAPKPTKDDFEFIAQLGKGAFGKVVLVRKKDTGAEYAMKVVFKQNVLDHGRVQDLFSERSVLRRSKHPFICKLEYTFQSEHKLFFVMEYLQGGDLDTLLNSMEGKRFDEPTAQFYAAEVWMALQYLHENVIIYRDLKPENILLSEEGHACLSDFGLSKDFRDSGDGQDRANSFVGSPFYVSPDVLRQKKYGKEVDWWSFGILLFRMLSGAVPFKGSNIRAVFDAILHGALSFSQFPWLTAPAKDLITRCLNKDEKLRITGPEIQAHPFFEGMDWDKLYKKQIPPPPAHRAHEEKRKKASGALAPTTIEEISKSPGVGLGQSQQKLFMGFSYQCPNQGHL
uniref:Protein kinase domain-containing protein n=1 Tax=Eutreptiella gymnastica TaxID=73025 RepID=A0A7S1NSP2_9EUGL|mmetsp:Transcript_81913/g.144642  ORF Transcript_81913/g.144642 Transcript_81913/m.144642 type:complete len:380 (+) Transcript_81913:69-1208(+)